MKQTRKRTINTNLVKTITACIVSCVSFLSSVQFSPINSFAAEPDEISAVFYTEQTFTISEGVSDKWTSYTKINTLGQGSHSSPINLLSQKNPVALSMDLVSNGSMTQIGFGTQGQLQLIPFYDSSSWKSNEVHNVTFVFYPDTDFVDPGTEDGAVYNIKSELYIDNKLESTYSNTRASTGASATYQFSELRFFHVYSTNTEAQSLTVKNIRITNKIEGSVDVSAFNDGSVFSIEDNVVIGYTGNGQSTKIRIPSFINGTQVTGLGDNVFKNCTELTEITIPYSVTDIDSYAFDNCISLSGINVDANNTHYSSLNGVLFDYDKSKLVLYPCNKQDSSYVIPDGVQSIAYKAFNGCDSLNSISLPYGITDIGKYAFSYCTNLKDINLPQSVTNIGIGAFYNCSSLESISVPNGVEDISDFTFSNCASLTDINIPNEATRIGDYAFSYCTGLSNITIPENVAYIGSYAFIGCTALSNIEIPGNVKSIGNFTFNNCTNLTDIKVAADNTYYSSLDGVLFNHDKTKLIQYPIGKADTSYSIPSEVSNISISAFEGCSNLYKIIIPNNVINIGYFAFYDCPALNMVCYSGTDNEFDNINIGIDNNSLTTANIVYNYKPDNLTYTYNEESGEFMFTITMMSELNVVSDAFVAIYDSYDRFYSVAKKENINLSIGMNTIDLSFECKNLPDNFKLKGFVWNKNMKPIINAIQPK